MVLTNQLFYSVVVLSFNDTCIGDNFSKMTVTVLFLLALLTASLASDDDDLDIVTEAPSEFSNIYEYTNISFMKVS